MPSREEQPKQTAKTYQNPPQTAYYFTKVNSRNLWRLMEGLQKPPREKAFIGMDAFTTNELSRAYWDKLYI